MTPLTCEAARRRLQLFHDDELPVSEQIAVASHVEWCEACADALAELRFMRVALRASAPGRHVLSTEEAGSLQSAIAGRLQAERDLSLANRVREMFDDMHLVYAGLGAMAAIVVCIGVTLGMMRVATAGRTSLAMIINVLATPGSNENPVPVNGPVLMPRAVGEAFSTATDDTSEEDRVFTLAAVVTREGRIRNLELLQANGGEDKLDDAKLVDNLLTAVSRARFEPARVDGLPVAVNMVWLVARTTVRATKPPSGLSVRPGPKKGSASLEPAIAPPGTA
jgi:hypothetical protein